jgi:hypothetical protein
MTDGLKFNIKSATFVISFPTNQRIIMNNKLNNKIYKLIPTASVV